MAPAIPKDSLVLVTGANGFLGSHIVAKFLEAGYRVRGTARDITKLKGVSDKWETQFGKGRFEAVVVADMAAEGAYDSSMQGAAAVIHVASDKSFSPDPNAVIPTVVAGLNSILESATKVSTIKRFVYTSSSDAASKAVLEGEKHIDSKSWNEASPAAAWAPPPYDWDRAPHVYAASKVAGEKALWKFVEERKPAFVVNSVLPSCVFGKLLDPALNPSTAGLPIQLLKGEPVIWDPCWFVDVQDIALLHVSATIEEDVKGERIFGYTETFGWNGILRVLRKIRPDREILADYVDDKIQERSTVSTERSVELLKRLGQDGWTSFEKSIADNVEGL